MLKKKLFYKLQLSISTLALSGLMMGHPVQAMEGDHPNPWARIAALAKAKESGKEKANEMSEEKIEEIIPSRVPAGFWMEDMVEEESSWIDGEDTSAFSPNEPDFLHEPDLYQEPEDKNPVDNSGLGVLCQAIEHTSDNRSTTTTTTTTTTTIPTPQLPMVQNYGMNPYPYNHGNGQVAFHAPGLGVPVIYGAPGMHFTVNFYGLPHAPMQGPVHGLVAGAQAPVMLAPVFVNQAPPRGKKRKIDGALDMREAKRPYLGVTMTLGEVVAQLQHARFERVYTELGHIKFSLKDHELMINIKDLEANLFPSMPENHQSFLDLLINSVSNLKQKESCKREIYVMALNHGIHHQPSQLLTDYMASCNAAGQASFKHFKKVFKESLVKKGQHENIWKYPLSYGEPIFMYLKPATTERRNTLSGKRKEIFLAQCLREGALFNSFKSHYLNVRYLLQGTNDEDPNPVDLASQNLMISDVSTYILSILVKDLMMDKRIYLSK